MTTETTEQTTAELREIIQTQQETIARQEQALERILEIQADLRARCDAFLAARDGDQDDDDDGADEEELERARVAAAQPILDHAAALLREWQHAVQVPVLMFSVKFDDDGRVEEIEPAY